MAHVTVDPSSTTAERTWAIVTLALAGAALGLLFAGVPHGASGDGYVRFAKLDELLRHGTLAPERYSCATTMARRT